MSGQHWKILKLAFQDQIGFLFDTYLCNSLPKMVTGLDISQTKEKKIPYEESQFKNRHINAENKLVVAREKRGRAMGRTGERYSEVQTSSYESHHHVVHQKLILCYMSTLLQFKQISHRDVKCSVGNGVHNAILNM